MERGAEPARRGEIVELKPRPGLILGLRLREYVFIAKRIFIYPFMPIVYMKMSKMYTENPYFEKRLPKWIETKTPFFFSSVNDQNVLMLLQSQVCHVI